jgi:hypothetical protein
VNDDISFKTLLLRKEGSGGDLVDKDGMVVNGEGERKKTRVLNMSDTVPLDLHVQNDTLSTLRHSKVGFFKESMDYQSFYDRLLVEGQFEVKVTFMGGNMVLLQSPCEGELEEVMRFNKVWWDKCFTKIIPWKPNLLSECREIWIQVYGIPLHVWDEGSFKMIAGRFGVFLDFDEATVAKQRLDVARVKLRTVRRGMIDTVLQLCVQGVLYDVWVVEERCSFGEERSLEREDGFQNERTSNSCSDENGGISGELGWKGDDGDLFSDGRSDSEGSASYNVLLGLQEEVRQQPASVIDVIEGIRNIDSQSQSDGVMMVGESVSGEPTLEEHVEEGGECFSLIPSGIGVVEQIEVRGVFVEPVADHSNILVEERALLENTEHLGDDVVHSAGPFELDRVVRPVEPICAPWNPVTEPEVNISRAQKQNSVDGCEEQREGVQKQQEVGIEVAANGGLCGDDVVRISQLSESSGDSMPDRGGRSRKKNPKGGPYNSPRPIPPLIGIPKCRQLEMSMKVAGRRLKEVVKNNQSIAPTPTQHLQQQGEADVPAIDLEVVLPMPNYGLNLLFDNEGGFIPESSSETGGAEDPKVEEAKTLIGIQKDVGVSFVMGEEEIQNKLVELDDSDKLKIVELEQENVS